MRELIEDIETLIEELKAELNEKESKYKEIKYTFKKKARVLLLEINWIRGKINSAEKISVMCNDKKEKK